MSYEKTTWADGDVVSAARLNKIENQLEALENGSGQSNIFCVHEMLGHVLDATWQEIYDAFASDKLVFISTNISGESFNGFEHKEIISVQSGTQYEHTSYSITDSNYAYYVADSADGYPALDD